MKGLRIDFNRFLGIAIGLWVLVIFGGMLVDVMEVDAAQYASMGREMRDNDSWLEVYERGEDYNSLGNPDKPPLLFWLSAASFTLLGVSDFSYKLVSVLVALLGALSVYELGRLIYDSRTARIAVIIYSSALGFILMLNDVRTDTLLVGWVAFASWQLERYLRTKRWSAWFLAFSGIALAMLAKGPLGLIAVAAPFGADALLRRDWKRIFRWEWLLGLGLILLWLMPMLVGLYQQWGWDHGVVYYFWTQSFGRITGENVWQDDTSPFYFTHTFLWTFLPWSLLVITALFRNLFELRRQLNNALSGEFIATSGFVLLFLAMSSSHFKLPHYIYITFPFAALLTADFLADIQAGTRVFRWLSMFQFLIGLLILLISAVVEFWIFPGGFGWGFLIGAAFIAMVAAFFQQFDGFLKLFGPSLIALLVFGLVANYIFYPNLLKYQASSLAGKYIHEQALQVDEVALFAIGEESIHALDFYAEMTVPHITHPDSLLQAGQQQRYVYTNQAGVDTLISAGYQLKTVKNWPFFRVTHLNGHFLNPGKRAESLEERFFVLLSR
jgi:4-amino-4-deoxy-L-arabinose transferase-like glycosyltransferase